MAPNVVDPPKNVEDTDIVRNFSRSQSTVDDSNLDKVESGSETKLIPVEEKWWETTLQVLVPFLIAGVGTIGAGVVFGIVARWEVFRNVSELIIMVPALIGLKGNLDMCLASRLSTQANLGNMLNFKNMVSMVIGNICLVQIQAIVASFIVALFAIAVNAAINGNSTLETSIMVIAAAMFTATTSCLVLDIVLTTVIIVAKRFRMNPDNLATPLAASIGDLVSLSLLSVIASLLYANIETKFWINYVVIIIYLCLLPLWIFIVIRNKFTRHVLKSGWVPVISALFISGMGGLVLDSAVGKYDGFEVFQPIINGIGGNLVSVQASRIATKLHQTTELGIMPAFSKIFEWPHRALFKGVPYAKTARILIAMSIPGQVVFIFVADAIHMSASTLDAAFVFTYLTANIIQITMLLFVAHIIIHAMWRWKIDPDNSSIPYLTALGDLSGSSLLLIAFIFLHAIGRPYSDSQE
ncbi:solute carrier family 41 member 2-like isoform X2 [Phlebotomus papatasi]|uniref:solute carrier family 41 member 2-like isoform X2 n=1 Tax=Phlebotomus papatasi TaxID=29031 RepID=UPI00248368CF|nr:solute carrier family 41 member 2-like isoform X2 [Phlebotomus papatasi]